MNLSIKSRQLEKYSRVENGKQKGRSKEEYEALTHFKNKDGEN